MHDERSPGVVIAVATYRRQALLEELLASLATLDVKDERVHVLVVDNDQGESSRGVCQAHFRSLPLSYAVEARKGIAHVRNALVREARKLAPEYLVFVDDDQWVEPNWLSALLETAQNYDADVVAGPVVPVFDDQAPNWVVRGRFFERARHATGTSIRFAGAGNLLVRANLLFQADAPFDVRFNSGGEDTHLTERLHYAGATMVWCDQAVSYERVPGARTSVAWLLQRHFRRGVIIARCARLVESGPRRVTARLAKSIGSIGAGVLIAPGIVFDTRVNGVRSLIRIAYGLGGLVGLAAGGGSGRQ